MEIYQGRATFSGIAIGRMLFYYREEYQIRQYLISNVQQEIASFHSARIQAKEKLLEQEKNFQETDPEKAALYRTQADLLESQSFIRAVESVISSDKVNAAYGVKTARDEAAATLSIVEEPFIRKRIEGIREISNLLIEILGGISPRIDLGKEPVILVAESLLPSEILEMNKDQLLAVVTRQGSEVSHASIMAKTMEIPSLVDIEVQPEWDGSFGIVDGYTGTLYLNPDVEVQKEYEIRRQADLEEREALLKLRNEKDRTKDGREISLLANIGNLDDLNSVLFYGASGIGLLRSEFQYLGRENYPLEEELFQAYKKVAETMGDRPAVIRTADLGGDKQSDYLNIPSETNPIMGNRGIRLCLDRKEMFRDQLRAIYRASAYGNLAIMFPMISSEKEIDEIQQLIAEVKAELTKEQIPYKDIETGIMIETPAAVMISRELARRVDFLSLGTNDLTQYTLAMDRQNPLLKDKYDDHHPAVLRMIQMVVESGHQEGCRVCICGELAADTALTARFLKMGVDSLSVVPVCILPVRKALRETDLREC